MVRSVRSPKVIEVTEGLAYKRTCEDYLNDSIINIGQNT